jgi:hypothetical protein
LQYLVHIVHLSTSQQIITSVFFFLFGFAEGFKPIEEEEKQEAEYEYVEEDKYANENIEDNLEFMDDDLVVHQGNTDEVEFELEDDFDIQNEDGFHVFQQHKNDNPMIRIGNQMMLGPQQQPQSYFERGRDKGSKEKTSDHKAGKRGRSVSILAVKDAKIELDLLSAILDDVENAEKQVEADIQKNEDADYE